MSEAPAQNTDPKPRRRPMPSGMPNSSPANLNAVGNSLRLEREKRGQKLDAIADMLKIRRIYLQAIEDSDWPNLPELVYAQGFVRSYADYLGLDGAEKAAQFKKEFRGGPRVMELDMPKPLEDNQTPDWKIITTVIVGLGVAYIGWSALHPSEKPDSIPPAPTAETETAAPAPDIAQPPPSTASSTAPAAPGTPAATPASATTAAPATSTPGATTAAATPTAAANAPATQPTMAAQPSSSASGKPAQTGTAYGSTTPTHVTITAAEDSWVQVHAADGQVVFSRVMRPGDYYRVPTDAGLTLTTGNLAGLYFDVDGHGMAPSDAPGTVMRDLPLAPENLLQSLTSLNKTPEKTSDKASEKTPAPSFSKYNDQSQ